VHQEYWLITFSFKKFQSNIVIVDGLHSWSMILTSLSFHIFSMGWGAKDKKKTDEVSAGRIILMKLMVRFL